MYVLAPAGLWLSESPPPFLHAIVEFAAERIVWLRAVAADRIVDTNHERSRGDHHASRRSHPSAPTPAPSFVGLERFVCGSLNHRHPQPHQLAKIISFSWILPELPPTYGLASSAHNATWQHGPEWQAGGRQAGRHISYADADESVPRVPSLCTERCRNAARCTLHPMMA